MTIFNLSLVIIIPLLYLLVFLYFRNKYRKQIQYRKQDRDSYGYIYFYRGAWEITNLFFVKCGRTIEVKSRLSSGKTSNPFGLWLMGVVRVKDDVFAESLIHEKFNTFRLKTMQVNFWYLTFSFIYFIIFRDKKVRKEKRVNKLKHLNKTIAKNEWFLYLPIMFFMWCVLDFKLTRKYKEII